MKKLYRQKQCEIGGVCGGLGDYLNIDVTIIRIIFIVLLFTPFPIIISYILLWMIAPKEKDELNI